MKMQNGSSESRLKEASKREDLMRRLHSIEAKIAAASSLIKYELRETVTFAGKFLSVCNYHNNFTSDIDEKIVCISHHFY